MHLKMSPANCRVRSCRFGICGAKQCNNIAVSVCDDCMFWMTIRRIQIDPFTSIVSLAYQYWTHSENNNIVHLCLFNRQHNIGYFNDYRIAVSNFKHRKGIIITIFNFYRYRLVPLLQLWLFQVSCLLKARLVFGAMMTTYHGTHFGDIRTKM